MPQTIDELRKVRLEKLEQIKTFGFDPYPAKSIREQVIVQAKDLMGKSVAVAGRIMAIRGHGGIQFIDLVDDSGKIQTVFKKDLLEEKLRKLLLLIDLGDFLAVQGEVFKTQAGETSVLVKKFQILAKTLRPLPSSWYGLKDNEERFRKRYLDFIFNPEVKEKIKARNRIIKYLRKFLDEKGFLEIETPILETDASGAAAQPFVTHINAYDIDLYLRICMGELWQKRMLVGGFDKTYEIGRAFRNEGVDFQHNPEFTMLEYYWGYADYEDNMQLHEELFSGLVKELTGSYKLTSGNQELDFTPPFRRLTYRDALVEFADLDLENFLTRESLAKEIEKRGLEIDPKAGRGKLIDDFYKETVRPKLVGPLFLIDHPIDISPLAKKTSDPKYVQRFQLLILGAELSNSYSELNDPQDQKERFLEQAKLIDAGDEEAMGVDWDYVEAMEYGMPPISGTGIGIDRLTALLTDSHSLREIITFPLMKPDKPITVLVQDDGKQLAGTKIMTPKENNEISFIDKNVKEKFPGMKFGVAIIEGVDIHKASKELEKFKDEFMKGFSGMTLDQVDDLPTIKAYRNIFKAFGVDWHSRHPSADALLRRIVSGKGLYNVNTLVDSYNLAVLDSRIALGAFDYQKLIFPVVLRLAGKDEKVTLLGDEESTKIKEGEMIYADQSRVMTLDLNYRDCDYTKITNETKNVVLYADGTPEISSEEVMKGLEKGIEFIIKFSGGKLTKKFIVE